MKILATIPALLAAVILTDVQWTVMQSITWVEMILADDQRTEVPLLNVLIDTVSGKTSCKSCQFIDRESNSDQENTLKILSQSIEVAPITYSKFTCASSEGKDLIRVSPGNLLPDDPTPRSINHPPQA